jgi:hypothetical protein
MGNYLVLVAFGLPALCRDWLLISTRSIQGLKRVNSLLKGVTQKFSLQQASQEIVQEVQAI